MTPAEEAAKFKADLAEQTKKLIEENNKKFDEIIGANDMVKNFVALQKQLTEAKTIEEVQSIKTTLKGFEDTLLEMKAAAEKNNLPIIKKVSKKNMLGMIGKSFAMGVADLHQKGMIQKFLSKEVKELKIYTSSETINDAGQKVSLIPNLGKKVDNPMSDATSVVPIGTGIPQSLTQFEPGLTRVSRRKPFITQLIDLARSMSLVISWVEQTNVDTGTAFSISEGGAGSGTYGSFRWTENFSQVQNIQAMSKITNEMLADLNNAQNEVQVEIMELLGLKLDSQVLNGNGTAPQMKGILQYAQAFTNAGNLSVAAPNNYDALIAAILQIKINGVKSGIAAAGEVINIFEPTDIVLHPADKTAMELTKDTLNRYVMQMYPDLATGGKSIADCKITENIGQPIGTYLVMDGSKSHARIREDAEIVLGYVNTDFEDNKVSVKGRLRAAHYIKSNQVNAFVSDSFANTKLAIQAT